MKVIEISRSLRREWQFMLRDRAALLWITIALLLSSAAVGMGLLEISAQRAELAELTRLDTEDRKRVLSKQSDWGAAGYYTFHLVSDPPSNFAFAALGMRDVATWKHRIRMLALEGQIYDSDTANPDIALVGRIDFAFVAALLTPLLIILLLFDMKSSERAAGRFELIEASGQNVWRFRTLVRLGVLALALLLPLFIGAVISQAKLSLLLAAAVSVIIYILFWAWLSSRVFSARRNGATNLAWGLGLWLFFCLLLPASLTAAINASIPLPKSNEITLTQREAVNDAWDLPVAETMMPFVKRHPQWKEYSKLPDTFTWTWYYAFQQVGDQTVEPLSLVYRKGREQRDRAALWTSLISPATAMQRILERLANTDMQAAAHYEQKVRDYHASLRAFYYLKLFKVQSFDAQSAFDSLPIFE